MMTPLRAGPVTIPMEMMAHGADDPHGLAPLLGRKGFGDQGRAHGHDHGRPGALGDPEPDEVKDIGCQAAQARGKGEDRESQKVDLFLAQDVPEPSEAQHQGGHGQQVGQHDPLDHGEAGAKGGCHGGQRDIDDAAVDGGQKDAGPHGGKRMPLTMVIVC